MRVHERPPGSVEEASPPPICEETRPRAGREGRPEDRTPMHRQPEANMATVRQTCLRDHVLIMAASLLRKGGGRG